MNYHKQIHLFQLFDCFVFFLIAMHAEMLNVAKSSVKGELTAQLSAQTQFPSKQIYPCRKVEGYCAEVHMSTWAMTCPIRAWS